MSSRPAGGKQEERLMPWNPSRETIIREREHAACVKRERLRDEFARTALEGILSGRPSESTYTGHEVADAAYKIADAMLAAREAKEEGR